MSPLDLTPAMILSPRDQRLIARRVESDRSRQAHSRKRIAELRKAREVFA